MELGFWFTGGVGVAAPAPPLGWWGWADGGSAVAEHLANGQIVQEIRLVAAPKETTFDPTGTRLAVSSWSDPRALVVDVASGADVFALEGHKDRLSEVAWSPDGESIATASFDGSARVFDARTGRQRFAVPTRGGAMYDLHWSPDATRLVTGDSDGTARVWLLTEGGGR